LRHKCRRDAPFGNLAIAGANTQRFAGLKVVLENDHNGIHVGVHQGAAAGSGDREGVTGGTPPACSTGWYDIGGTSLSCPQWAGLVAIADQLNGGGLGLINPALYKVANSSNYAADFFDVTVGNNTNPNVSPAVPGYPATKGWDPITGLGTPDAAKLLPDLVAAAH